MKLYSRPYKPDPEKACEACIFGAGEHAEWCPVSEFRVVNGLLLWDSPGAEYPILASDAECVNPGSEATVYNLCEPRVPDLFLSSLNNANQNDPYSENL